MSDPHTHLPSPADMEILVRRAGELAHHYFEDARLKSWEKEGNSPVSEADIAVDAYLEDALVKLLPGSGWLSEEIEDDVNRLSHDLIWVVDPIDGTRSFINGLDGWAVSVALIEKGRPVMAAIYAPVRDEYYAAVRGQGATLNGKPIRVSDKADIASATMMGDEKGFRSPHWPVAWPEGMACKPLHAIALRLCEIARGAAEACVTFRPMQEWDIAGADLILTEAGGLLETADRETLVYNQKDPVFGNLIGSNRLVREALHDRVGPALAAWRAKEASQKETQ